MAFMTREQLVAFGLTDEQVENVMKEHGKAMSEVLGKAETAETELKRYRKGGDLYNDPAEFERLKTFERDTLTKETNAKKTAGLTKLYKSANASDGAIKLLISGTDLEKIELDDKGDVKGGADILKNAKAEYADLFAANGNAGVPQASDGQNGGGSLQKKQAVY